MADYNGRTLKTLGTIERKNGEEQVRLSLDECTSQEGKTFRFINVRLWYQSSNGQWKPGRQGLTVRKTEVRDFALALKAGLDAMNEQGKPSPAPVPRPRSAAHGDPRTGTLLEPLEADPEGMF